MDRKAIVLLACGHLADDYNQSFLPALLPLLVAQRHLSYAAAAALVLAQAMSSSFIQPAIGYLADKRPMPWIAGLGLALAGLGITLIGFMPTYELIFAAALLSGIGVAMFHPEAARFTNLAAGPKKASGMRWFSVGGNLGFAIGPAFATAAIALYGIHGTFLAVIPVAVVATLILLDAPRMRAFANKPAGRTGAAAAPDDWPAFLWLSAFVIVRSMVYIGLVAFIPLYFVHVVHVSPETANIVLTVYLLAGVPGTIVGGPLADRHGRRALIWFSCGTALIGVFALVAATASGGPFALAGGFLVAAVTGALITSSGPAQIVLGQEYLPNRLGVASGVTLGLSVSLGGMFSPVLGAIGDRWGLVATLLAIGAISCLALALSFALPNPERRRALLEARRTAIA